MPINVNDQRLLSAFGLEKGERKEFRVGDETCGVHGAFVIHLRRDEDQPFANPAGCNPAAQPSINCWITGKGMKALALIFSSDNTNPFCIF